MQKENFLQIAYGAYGVFCEVQQVQRWTTYQTRIKVSNSVPLFETFDYDQGVCNGRRSAKAICLAESYDRFKNIEAL